MHFDIDTFRMLWFMSLLLVIQTIKPTSKRQLSVWQLECELGMITDAACPIDGGWSPWNPWSACQGPCDDVGHRHRTRECTNPTPSQDGLPCSGPDEQSEICFLTNCTVADYRHLIVGDSSRMAALHYLEAAPALLERCLEMECPFEAIEAALSYDNTWQLNSESLWNALQCVKRNIGCVTAGEWGAWGAWSACGARCGRGLRWRLRRCDAPPPSDSSLLCMGTPLQAEDCIGDQCAISNQHAEGSWGAWTSWTACSEKCGIGVRRRRRICHETYTVHASGTWGTHCRGQYDQLEVCENPVCHLDGGWSGWGGWGSCSRQCGAGKRSRTRSCTRPIPTGDGKPCVGQKTEIGSCHMTPCGGYSHIIALFQGESSLHYDLSNKRATLFHFYTRFLPLSAHGILIRREAGDESFVRLSLQKWHICLDACGANRFCCLPRSCTQWSIEPAVWHTALVTVTTAIGMLRLDDAPMSILVAWPCLPDLPEDKLHVYVGEKFQGQVQELVLNFIPLKLTANRNREVLNSAFFPAAVSNVAFDVGNTMESYLHINNDHYLRLPCFVNQDEWELALTIKPNKESGTILFIKNEDDDNLLHLSLENMRLKLILAFGSFKTESSSTMECLPDAWVDVSVRKKQPTNAIELSINAGESLHVLYEDEIIRKYFNISTDNIAHASCAICTDEFFIGGFPNEMNATVDLVPFSGILASVRVNNDLIDLHQHSLERCKDNKVHFSSRTASVSGSYHETAWGKSNRLNLTCLHERVLRMPRAAKWLFLDTYYNSVPDALTDKAIKSFDNGRILKLVATADNDLRGFYTCRAHRNRLTRNVITYGVKGKVEYKLHGPDKTTAIAVFTTLAIVLGTLLWLFIEGIHDLRTGYGFFRDPHWSPEEEAREVCKCIDQNIGLIGSRSAATKAKAEVMRMLKSMPHGMHGSRTSFTAQEPQGLLDLQKTSFMSEEPEDLPVLPEANNSTKRSAHNSHRFDPYCTNSPRIGSANSTALTSSSSFELISPRLLCSKLLMTKGPRSYRDSLSSKGRMSRAKYPKPEPKYSGLSPAQKILQKFRQLKPDDIF